MHGTTWVRRGFQMTWEQMAREGDGKLCVAEGKKIKKIMEKMTRND